MTMTAFETATLAFQKATIGFQESTTAFQNASLDLQAKALDLQADSVFVQELTIYANVGVGLLHAALIGFGLWMMHRASTDRNKTMDADRVQADKRHENWQRAQDEDRRRADQRHEEAMAALKELIARTASPSSPPGPAAA